MKRIFLLSCFVFVTVTLPLMCGGWFLARAMLIDRAQETIDSVLARAAVKARDDDRLAELTRVAFESFGRDAEDLPLLAKLRPAIESKALPDFVRVPEGVTDSIVLRGRADNAARFMVLLLERAGFGARVYAMVTPTAAHPAVQAALRDGRDALVDPYNGVIGWADGGAIGPDTIRGGLAAGTKLDRLVKALGPGAQPGFYASLHHGFSAPEGELLVIRPVMPPQKPGVYEIGRRDGDSGDVLTKGGQFGFTPYLHYIGHKYDRNWTRFFQVSQDVRVTFRLTEDAFPGALRSVRTPPVFQDARTLVWELKAGEALVFEDGRSRRSWLRLRSYVPVDQIVIETLPETG